MNLRSAEIEVLCRALPTDIWPPTDVLLPPCTCGRHLKKKKKKADHVMTANQNKMQQK